jgi:DNA replication protein DnaC
MTAFLKIDRCKVCCLEIPWEWVPPVDLRGKLLAGTGVWRSALVDGVCPKCAQAIEERHQQERRTCTLREQFIRELGVKPYRKYRFEQYQVTPGNKAAFERAKGFNPSNDNLYLWGPCGVGKTHLAVAILRRCFARGGSIALVTPFQLIRKLRMKPPNEEQREIDGFIRVQALVLDDFGDGTETPYARQILQEILDGRDFNDRGGLIVTSHHSLTALARRFNDRSIPSRLAGLCQVVEISGGDHRPLQHTGQRKSSNSTSS